MRSTNSNQAHLIPVENINTHVAVERFDSIGYWTTAFMILFEAGQTGGGHH
jgi:hypothetical protein